MKGVRLAMRQTQLPSLRYRLSRRSLLRFSAGAVLTLAARPLNSLAGTPGSPRRALIVAQYAEPINLNPIIEMVDRPALQIESNVYDTLVRFNYQTGELAPYLATKWARTDAKTWVFQLREGVQFHKGYGEFTAEDVEFFANYIIQEKKPLFFRYSAVESVKAVGKYTVEFKTKEPFAPLLYFVGTGLGGFIVSKRAHKELGGDEAYGRTPIGTGPFEFISWERGNQVVIRRNRRYWRQGRPLLEEIVYRPVPDPFVRRTLLKTGDVDLIVSPDYKDIAEFRRDAKYTVSSTPGWSFDYTQTNVERPPFNIKKVRQAISHAVGRQELARNVYFGEATPDDDPLPPGFPGDTPDIERYSNEANIVKAKSLLSEAGFSQGLKTTCITSERPSARRSLQIMASQLEKAGITVEIQNLETATYQARWRKGDFDLATEFIVIGTPDPDSAMYHFFHTGTNNHGYENRLVDRLLDEARGATDQKRRIDLYRRVLGIALDDAPFTYTAHSNVVFIAKKGLVGVPLTPQEIYLSFETTSWE